MLSFKLLLILTTICSVISYIIVKYRRQKIFSLYKELDIYQKRECIKSSYFWTVITLIVFFSNICLILEIMFKITFINDMFEPISIENQMKISKSVVLFYCMGLFMVNQLVNLEFFIKYYNITENFLNVLKNENSNENYKPSKDELITAQQTIHQFIHFQTILDKNIKCLNKLIILSNISLISGYILLILFELSNFRYNILHLRVLVITIMLLYFCLSQITLLIKRRIPRKKSSMK